MNQSTDRLRDVLIVGSGAAGGAAAAHLSAAGHDVLVLERDPEDRIKPCGGGMAASVQQWFPFSLEPAVEQVIRRVDFSWCLKDLWPNCPVKPPSGLCGGNAWISCWRNRPQAGAERLVDAAVSDVSKDCDNWQVTAKDGRRWRSRAVVIADGSGSPWPQRLGIGARKVQTASTMSVRLEGQGTLEDGTTRFEFGLVKQGFAWAFPLAGGVNIGVGACGSKMRTRGPCGGLPIWFA